MAAATLNPWNDTPARRPSAVDLGADANGAFVLADEDVDQYQNDISPIRDGTQPYAAMFNRLLEAGVAAGATMPALVVTVRFNAGDPIVDSFISPRTTRQIEEIEVVDNDVGDTTIRVVDTTLPPVIGGPRATIHDGAFPSIVAVNYSTTGYRGVTVTTTDSGVAADLGFTVEIM